MSKEMVNHILSLLTVGKTPVLRLRPRKGVDVRLVEVRSSDSSRFQAVFLDTAEKNEPLVVPHDAIIFGSLTVEEVICPEDSAA